MYNEQIKRGFIEHYSQKESVRNLVAGIFNVLSRYEEECSTDFSLMSLPQAQRSFDGTGGMRVNNAKVALHILREYVRWLASNGHEVSDAAEKIEIAPLVTIRKRMVSSPQGLALSLDRAFPDTDISAIQHVYRSYFWLAFIGLLDFEAVDVKSPEVDFKQMRILYRGSDMVHTIYKEAFVDLYMAATLTEFKEPHGRAGTIRPRTSGDLLLRGKFPSPSKQDAILQTIRQASSRAFNRLQRQYEGREVSPGFSYGLSYKRVYLSGVFYRTREDERRGIEPDFSEVVDHEMQYLPQDTFDRRSRNYTRHKLRSAMMRNYKSDYDNWKIAFPQ